jgi:hypothetical protein
MQICGPSQALASAVLLNTPQPIEGAWACSRLQRAGADRWDVRTVARAVPGCLTQRAVHRNSSMPRSGVSVQYAQAWHFAPLMREGACDLIAACIPAYTAVGGHKLGCYTTASNLTLHDCNSNEDTDNSTVRLTDYSGNADMLRSAV